MPRHASIQDMGEMLDLVWMLTSKDADNNTQLATSIAEEIEARSGYPSKALLATRKHPPRGGGAGGQAAEGEEGSSGGGLSAPRWMSSRVLR